MHITGPTYYYGYNAGVVQMSIFLESSPGEIKGHCTNYLDQYLTTATLLLNLLSLYDLQRQVSHAQPIILPYRNSDKYLWDHILCCVQGSQSLKSSLQHSSMVLVLEALFNASFKLLAHTGFNIFVVIH
jgi:hypothetical protein